MSILPLPQGMNPLLPKLPASAQVLSVLGIPAINKVLASSLLTGSLLTKQNIGGYIFDAVFSVDHESPLEITQHPVQTGANITDHSYLQPKTLVFEIGMSDVSASYISSMFAGGSSKSVSAYKILKQMQDSRTPLSVYTRLGSYSNMLIKNITVKDTPQTAYGLRASVHLQQIIVVDVPSIKLSANPNATNITNKGPQTPESVNSKKSILKQMQDIYKKGIW